MLKRVSVGALAAFLLLVPSSSSAATLAELQAQLAELLAQIQILQEQENQGGSSGTSVATSSSAGPLTLTAPNGGERWELGVMNSITWKPYGYEPEINPSHEVVAYLEKKTLFGFRTVGKVMPSGKASIHWETDIDEYGKYPSTGEYFIRIENTRTGQSDRSDKPFALTPRSVDLKVNNSDGPVKLRDGDRVRLSWKIRDSFTSCALYGVRSSLEEDSYHIIENVPTKTGSMTAYFRTYPGESSGWISMRCDKNGDNGRYDGVPVTLKDGPKPVEPMVTVLYPNGGEQLVYGSDTKIEFAQSGLSSVSIALYQSDRFLKWIAKNISPEPDGKDVYSHTWRGSAHDFGTGEAFKIYITGTPSTGTGYADDKSDGQFAIVRTQTSTTTPKEPVPVCEVSASRSTIQAGESVVIKWNAKYADYVILPSGDKGAPTGDQTYWPEKTTTYSFTFFGVGGKTACSKTVTVQNAPTTLLTPVVSVSATPQLITSAKSRVTLSWEATNATRCTLSYSGREQTNMPTKGTGIVYPTETTTYLVSCVNDPGNGKDGPSGAASVTVYYAQIYEDPLPCTVDGRFRSDACRLEASAYSALQNALSALQERIRALLP